MIITIDPLNPSSYANAARELRIYAKEIERKTEFLHQLILLKLSQDVDNGFRSAVYDDIFKVKAKKGGDTPAMGYRTPQVEVRISHGRDFSVIIAEGKEAIFVEFGAGVYHNGSGSPHPKGATFGWTIGSYGKHNGLKQEWAFFPEGDRSNGTGFTHGTPAQMPMYSALERVVAEIETMAKEVFRT